MVCFSRDIGCPYMTYGSFNSHQIYLLMTLPFDMLFKCRDQILISHQFAASLAQKSSLTFEAIIVRSIHSAQFGPCNIQI